ncbi:MAG: VanW family protein [Syntrophomonas sp.]
MHLAARILAGKIVESGQVFSMNNSIGPYIGARGFQKGPVYIGGQLSTTTGGGVCKMASTLYNVAVLCDLPIVERHSHGMPVPYVPYGQDATVSTGVADIKIKNDLPYPILIWAKGVDNTLYVAFYGQKPAPSVQWHHEILQQFKTYTIYRNNPSLPKGTEKTVVEGMDGAQVKSWITITKEDGSIKTKELGMSSYRPLPNVVERN